LGFTVYIVMAIICRAVVDGVTPSWNGYVGFALALLGACVIALGHRPT
jgi:small multidrug resistance family-3 protein